MKNRAGNRDEICSRFCFLCYPSSSRAISAGRGLSKRSRRPLKGCVNSSRAEWRAGRGIRSGSSVP